MLGSPGRPCGASENLHVSHVRWECKYHIVIIPKYRRKVLYGNLRRRVGRILRELCEQRGVELIATLGVT